MLGELFWLLLGGGFVAKEAIKEKSYKIGEHEYHKKHGYDMEKTRELKKLLLTPGKHAENAHIQAEIERRLGHRYNSKQYNYDIDRVAEEIAQKEGWKYFNLKKACNDPEYLKAIGAKPPYKK